MGRATLLENCTMERANFDFFGRMDAENGRRLLLFAHEMQF